MKTFLTSFYTFLLILFQGNNAFSNEIPCVPFSSIEQTNEGFLWKRALVIKKGEQEISFEKIHQDLYKEVQLFQDYLECLLPYFITLISNILSNPECPYDLKEIFLNLSHDHKEIGNVLLNNQPIEEIFPTEDPAILELVLKNEEVQTILNNNLKRLKTRNACIASFEYIDENNKQTTLPICTSEGKSIIFLSGIGNELIRILQKDDLFNKYEFIIFHRENTDKNHIAIDGFSKSLENLYKQVEEPNLTRDFKKMVQLLPTAQRAKDEVLKTISQRARDYLGASKPTLVIEDSILRVPKDLIEVKKDYENKFKEFRAKFCDSEQALRYYLFANIEKILNFSMNSNGLLVLNIYSSMDPCIHCTNALALECYLRNKEKFLKAPDAKKQGRLDSTLGGFFHKLYNKNPDIMPQAFILVSSQGPELQGGLARRLLAGKALDEQINQPILIDSETRLFFRHNGPTLPH